MCVISVEGVSVLERSVCFFPGRIFLRGELLQKNWAPEELGLREVGPKAFD